MAARRAETAGNRLWWLALVVALPACVCDLPVHCEIEHVYGAWEFMYSDGDAQTASLLPVLPPNHHQISDGSATCDTGALGGDVLTLELRRPNLVRKVPDGSGEVRG